MLKVVFKNLAIFIGKHLRWSDFFNENASLQSCNFIKKRLQHRRFPVNIANSLRTTVLKNICEPLFKRFPAWINNIASNIWSGHFLKKKKKSKIQLDKKNLPFHDALDHFVFLYFSNACQTVFALHNKRW